MALPDICKKGISVRQCYLSLIFYMANIDGSVDPSERSLIVKMADRFRLPSLSLEGREETPNYSEKEIKDAFTILKLQNLHYSFFLDLIAMALADGSILESEKMMLAQIAGLLELGNEEFYSLINFSQAVSNIDVKLGFDPMFEYAINDFCRWVSENSVTLYQQTILAIDEDVDRYLKKRL